MIFYGTNILIKQINSPYILNKKKSGLILHPGITLDSLVIIDQ